MAQGDESSEKTEEPTQRRISKAIEDGQVVNSKEVSNFFSILLLAFMVSLIAPWFMQGSSVLLKDFITRPHDFIINENSVPVILTMVVEAVALYIIVPLAIAMVVSIASVAVQHPFVFTTKSMEPKIDRIDPIEGWGVWRVL